VKPQESCYTGDSLVDFQTARAADVVFLACRNEDLEAERGIGGI